ncbi:hypothetical protein FIBSPDRAFT_140135 [Athelia psychrophila]|uniref:Uncharacterized protein n=1 Tax=Athelia psychrophila TaxID=1759441 RepID=A0A166BWG5_9AGAM|nr:hypothetical protein FIBSPDRAFT_140135 [Fibularhizoctonia sp. CBS 109695]
MAADYSALSKNAIRYQKQLVKQRKYNIILISSSPRPFPSLHNVPNTLSLTICSSLAASVLLIFVSGSCTIHSSTSVGARERVAEVPHARTRGHCCIMSTASSS